MKRTRRSLLPALVLLGALAPGLSALAQSTGAPTGVLVLRHAEPAMDQGRDPSLNDAGRARARSLLDVAGAAGVAAVYASQFKRTQETAAPLAEHLGLAVTTFAVDRETLETYPARLAEAVLARHRGRTVVIVNHSNTVPAIVEALGGGPAAAIAEDAFDHLFIVVIPEDGPVRTVRAQYGR